MKPNEDPIETKPNQTAPTQRSRASHSSKTFEWKEPIVTPPITNVDVDVEVKQEEIEDSPPNDELRDAIPPPPNRYQAPPLPRQAKRAAIDKSQSSLSGGQQRGGGQATPQMPTYPTVNTGNGNNNGLSVFDTQEDESQGITSMLNTNKTKNSVAAILYNRDYLLAKGSYVDCVLNTSMNSTVAGMTKCTLPRDVYSDNGNTLLLERGSEVTGEYQANIKQGQARLFVLWDRVKTNHGVVVDLASSATDSLGAGGVDGQVDTHFWQRFGGAMMLSLVDDLAGYMATSGGQNVNNFESSSNEAQNMAAEALKTTINIPPTFHKNQGERIGIFIARDIDFSQVYKLKAR
ncbi:type IV secretion system protein VirB10 [Aliivibrio salmonicida]